MKAVVVRPPKVGVSIEELKEPEPEPNKVKIRILNTGICGTDREIVNGKLITARPPNGRDYLILGHEAIGVVEESCCGFKKGEIVMPVNRRGCGHCLNCQIGRPDFCETGEFVEAGISGLDGFMREYYYDDPKWLVRVPYEIKDFAVMAQPLSDLEKSLEEILNVQKRVPIWTCDDGTYNCRKALVIGTGPVGILISLLLKTYGFEVWITNRRELNDMERTIAEEVGLEFYNSANGYDGLKEKVGRFDLIFDASNAFTYIASQVLPLLNYNGILGLFGFPQSGQLSLSYAELQSLIFRSNVIVGLVNGQKPHFEMAMVHLASWKTMWPKTVKAMITKEVPIEDEKEVKEVIMNKLPSEIKVKIVWSK